MFWRGLLCMATTKCAGQHEVDQHLNIQCQCLAAPTNISRKPLVDNEGRLQKQHFNFHKYCFIISSFYRFSYFVKQKGILSTSKPSTYFHVRLIHSAVRVSLINPTRWTLVKDALPTKLPRHKQETLLTFAKTQQLMIIVNFYLVGSMA